MTGQCFGTVKRGFAAAVFVVAIFLLSACSVMPEPLTLNEVKDFIAEDQSQIKKGQVPIKSLVTLEEAIARAIKYNLNRRVTAMEEALAQNVLTGAKMGLLPKLAAKAGYAWRNQPDSSISQTEGGGRSTSITYSEEVNLWSGDLTMTWNILDFGVSYFQAKQQANHHLISRERKRRALHNLIMQVRTSYWRVAAADIMNRRVDRAMKNAREALMKLEKMLQERLGEPSDIYRAQKSLIETIARLDGIRVDLSKAKPELASLMNLKPGTDFKIAAKPNDTYFAPVFPLALDEMEAIALLHRPELREAEYEKRISVEEIKKAFLRMFPGLELSFGRNNTSDHFKTHPAWYSAGMLVTWNLLDILSTPNRLIKADIQEEIARTQRMALNLAVLTQVHVSYRDYYSFIRQYEYSKRLWVLDQLINRTAKHAYENEVESMLGKLRMEVNVVQTELQFFDAYANAQNGLARLFASLGLNPLPDEMDDISVKGLTDTLRISFASWKKGKFPWNKFSDEPMDKADAAEKTGNVKKVDKASADSGPMGNSDDGMFKKIWSWFENLGDEEEASINNKLETIDRDTLIKQRSVAAEKTDNVKKVDTALANSKFIENSDDDIFKKVWSWFESLGDEEEASINSKLETIDRDTLLKQRAVIVEGARRKPETTYRPNQ